MNHDLTVSESVIINTSVTRVWEVMTNPALIKEYLYGTETITDWKEGSAIIFQGEYEGQQYKDKGLVLENKPSELLSYSYWSGFSGLEDKADNYSQIAYHLEQQSDQVTLFTWTQKGYPDETKQKHSKDGMPALLDSIKSIAERS